VSRLRGGGEAGGERVSRGSRRNKRVVAVRKVRMGSGIKHVARRGGLQGRGRRQEGGGGGQRRSGRRRRLNIN